ncbi:hypothetical protein DFA_01819 [Cavenderia fasciculata]|uniref:Uncharacterized protein n=1 Tax=Cavenderia fasciculata TaxID=261658 RepID=F4PUX1_CACFS|nr:uncharacterized protein DFA_01819 [Cavenderia fasciculata]EGG21933.1 hypothetical protein DFA_01819 [Cavenderia fasciculata]|eukprot:XP_004359784.1 hypothetical protein DFA_01819 [Cavenderia fasciculata]
MTLTESSVTNWINGSFLGPISKIIKEIEPTLEKKIQCSDNTNKILPLMERENQINEIITMVRGNLRMLETRFWSPARYGRMDLNIPALIGGKGIGKTTLANECARRLSESWTTILPNSTFFSLSLDFKNEYAITTDDLELNHGTIIGIRFAHCYYFKSKGYSYDFLTFYNLLKAKSLLQYFYIDQVIFQIKHEIGSDIFFLLHLDEIQCLLEYEDQYKLKDIYPGGLSKNLFQSIYTYFSSLCGVVIQPIVSGTSRIELLIRVKDPTNQSFGFVQVDLLSPQAVFDWINTYSNLNKDWMTNRFILQMLQDLGGLPLAIVFFLEYIFSSDFSKQKDFFLNQYQSFGYSQAFNHIAKKIDEHLGIGELLLDNKEVFTKLLGYSIRGTLISVNQQQDMFYNLESKGQTFLEKRGGLDEINTMRLENSDLE